MSGTDVGGDGTDRVGPPRTQSREVGPTKRMGMYLMEMNAKLG